MTLRIAMAMPMTSTPTMSPFRPGLAMKAVGDLAVEHERHEGGDDQEDDHPDQEDPRTRQLIGVEVACHRSSRTRRTSVRNL